MHIWHDKEGEDIQTDQKSNFDVDDDILSLA